MQGQQLSSGKAPRWPALQLAGPAWSIKASPTCRGLEVLQSLTLTIWWVQLLAVPPLHVMLPLQLPIWAWPLSLSPGLSTLLPYLPHRFPALATTHP